MKTMIVTFVLGFGFLFSGCAPQYVIRNQYIPPLGKNSKVCLQNCLKVKQQCKQRCAEDYSDCLSYAYDKAKQMQNKIDKSYKQRYARYQAKLSDYNFDIFDWQNRYDEKYNDWRYFSDKCSQNGDRYACGRRDELRYMIKNLRRNKPNKPREPRYITFDKTLVQQQSRCVKKCSCDDMFDSCFISCGGEVVPHKICVENCD